MFFIKSLEFSNKKFQISNPDGSYRSDWILLENHSLKYEISDFKMSLVDLSDDDNYVAVVEVLDTYGNGHYTNIIEIEN